MIDKKPKTFVVHSFAGDYDEWVSTDEFHYSWGCGPAGDLMLFRTEFNAAFGAKLDKDVRWYLYAPGTWHHVEVLDDVEVETEVGLVTNGK